ncbi:MAG TPA: flagellar assembly protein H [Sphingobium sp.]|nr:flagellar assembly protein H [Sphingobium sp.]
MMEATISVQPFGFDRVFRRATDPEDPPRTNTDELQSQIAALQDRVRQLRQENEETLAAARAHAFAEGLAQAREEREEAILAAADALHMGVEDLDRDLSSMMKEAAGLALLAAEILAGHALAREPGRAIDEALGRALTQVARGTPLHVRVHPDSLEDVERLVARRRAGERRALSITLVEDRDIAPHDAHISWGEGGLMVDAAARRAAVIRELGLTGEEEEA